MSQEGWIIGEPHAFEGIFVSDDLLHAFKDVIEVALCVDTTRERETNKLHLGGDE